MASDDLSNTISLLEWAKFVIAPGSLLAMVGLAYKFGGSVKEVRKDTLANAAEIAKQVIKTDAEIAKINVKTDALARDHSMLAIAVAALPTRDEMARNFDDVKREIKSSRTE